MPGRCIFPARQKYHWRKAPVVGKYPSGHFIRVFDPMSDYSGVFSAYRVTAGFAQKPSIYRYRIELSVTAISTRRFLLRASLLVPSTRGLALPYPFTLTIDGSMPAWTR
jgi:hypothetical protein